MGLGGKPTPKRQATRRALKAREPKLVENTRKAFFIKGPKTSQIVINAMKDMYMMKKPNAKMMNRKNQKLRPFEDHSSIEFFSNQLDASLFCYGAKSKKKSHSLTLGRTFNYQLLDMVEVSINVDDEFKCIRDFSGERKKSVQHGSKPMFIFQGDQYELSEDYKTVKSLILDFFRGDVVEKINLASLCRVIVCTATSDRLYFRHYAVNLKRSGTKIPNVELDEIGPRMNWTIRRVKSAEEELRKKAMKKPKARKSQKTVKNIERGTLGDKMGRVHMEKQDTKTMALRKFKSLKKRKGKGAAAEDGSSSKKQRASSAGDEE